MISTTEHPETSIEINGKRMACVEMGTGDPKDWLATIWPLPPP